MKLKYTFVMNQVADKMVAVAVGDDLTEFNGFIKMNDIGADIFKLLENDISMDDLISEMGKKYPQYNNDEVRECVTEFVEKLKNGNLIV